MKNAIFWDVTLCGSMFLHSVFKLLVTANAVPSSPILFTLMTETIRFSEMSVLTRATQSHPRRLHFSATEITEMLKSVCGEDCLSRKSV
jgi:hypothetical protein